MPSSNSEIVVAVAGSGKTTLLVQQALAQLDKTTAIVTYTKSNAEGIRKAIRDSYGLIPKSIEVRTWYDFLLNEGARPYQKAIPLDNRIRTLCFPNGRSAPWVGRANAGPFFLAGGEDLYSDKAARFILECDKAMNGAVLKRLSEIYDRIFIDEMQDLSGYDLELVEALLVAGIELLLVGDPRQTVFSTNHASKNSKYRGAGVLQRYEDWNGKGLCKLSYEVKTHRCHQEICAFSDLLWPEFDQTTSLSQLHTTHDGVFIVSSKNVESYMQKFEPVVLRYSKATSTMNYLAMNFGVAKGATFDRVLIFPHGPAKKFLKSGELKDIIKSRDKFYVGITRARSSVAIVFDGTSCLNVHEWSPS